MLQVLRRAGGCLVMTVPKAFIDQNHLQEGSRVELKVEGTCMLVSAPCKPRYSLQDLLDEMPGELPQVAGWDEMPAQGSEGF